MKTRAALVALSCIAFVGAAPPSPSAGIPATLVSVQGGIFRCSSGFPLDLAVATVKGAVTAPGMYFDYSLSYTSGGSPATAQARTLAAVSNVTDLGHGSVLVTQSICVPGSEPDDFNAISGTVAVSR